MDLCIALDVGIEGRFVSSARDPALRSDQEIIDEATANDVLRMRCQMVARHGKVLRTILRVGERER